MSTQTPPSPASPAQEREWCEFPGCTNAPRPVLCDFHAALTGLPNQPQPAPSPSAGTPHFYSWICVCGQRNETWERYCNRCARYQFVGEQAQAGTPPVGETALDALGRIKDLSAQQMADFRAVVAIAEERGAIIDRLRAQVTALEQERDEAHSYLSRVFVGRAPQCEPLPDMLGVCTQIDNLLTGLVPEDRAVRAEAEAFREQGRAEQAEATLAQAQEGQ